MQNRDHVQTPQSLAVSADGGIELSDDWLDHVIGGEQVQGVMPQYFGDYEQYDPLTFMLTQQVMTHLGE